MKNKEKKNVQLYKRNSFASGEKCIFYFFFSFNLIILMEYFVDLINLFERKKIVEGRPELFNRAFNENAIEQYNRTITNKHHNQISDFFVEIDH